MVRILDQPDFMQKLRQHELFDDFFGLIEDATQSQWVDVATGTGTRAIASVGSSTLVLTTGASDNDTEVIHSRGEAWEFAADRPFTIVARIDFTESNTDDANVGIGFMDAVDSESLNDDGAGPDGSSCYCVIYKVDGETSWRVDCALAAGSPQTITLTDQAAGRTHSDTTDFQTLMIRCDPVTSTELRVTYFLDPRGTTNWKQLKDTNGHLIQHTITLGTATEMQLFAQVKAGGGNAEALKIDYLGAFQKRDAVDTTT